MTTMRMMSAMLRTHGTSSTSGIRRLLPSASAAVSLRHFHSEPRLWQQQQQQQKVSIELVKQLRKETDAPLGQCKKALEESSGDMSAAKEWLRRKGVQLAQKKMGREAVQGLVAVAVDGGATHGAIVEVNSETDFVMRNDKFQGAVAQIVQSALRCREEDVEKLQAAEVAEGSGVTVGEALADLVGAIGENIQLRRVRIVAAEEEEGGLVAKYVHNAVADDMGQMGAIVAVKPTAGTADVDRDVMSGLARSLAMHITALMPRWLSREDVPSEVIEKEQSILRDKAVNEGKDEKYLDRVIAGQLNKFYQENVLLDQGWVMDDKVSVAKFLAENGVQVTGYARFKTGQQEEGVQQEAEDDKTE